jgi:O-antigen ligase
VLERPYHNLYFEFTAFILYLSDIFTGLFVLATAVWLMLSRTPWQFGPPALSVPLLLLPIVSLVSSRWAIDPALATHFATRLLLLFLLYLAIINLAPKHIIIQVGMGALLIVQGLTAVVQFLQQHNLGLSRLGEIPITLAGNFSILTANNLNWLRGYGLTPHPNILGGILAALFIPVTICFLQANGRSRWLWGVTAISGLGGILVSFSRSAWLGLFIAGTILVGYLLAQPATRRRYLSLILPFLLGGILMLTSFAWTQRELLRSRFTSLSNPQETRSISERQALNQITLSLIQENPWLGLGAAQLSYHIDTYASQMSDVEAQPVHNMPLLLTAEFGIFGGVLWLWLMLAPLILAGYQWYKSHLNLWTLSLTLSLLVLAITDLFDFYSWGWQQGRLMRWLLFGLWAEAVYNQQDLKVGEML